MYRMFMLMGQPTMLRWMPPDWGLHDLWGMSGPAPAGYGYAQLDSDGPWRLLPFADLAG